MYLTPERKKLTLRITTRTWARDSHSLFDPESENILSKLHLTDSHCALVRHDSNTHLVPGLSPESDQNELLAQIEAFDSGYLVN